MTTNNPSFQGIQYRLANNWFRLVPLEKYMHQPLTYLEIGAFHGANLLSVAETYGQHPNSVLHCIDPWEDYDDYNEYKNEQSNNFTTFANNIARSPHQKKIMIHRGFSHVEVPKLEEGIQFDIIYIDGNHEPDFVLEDAVLCFRKLKKGGILIFDDYGWGGPDLTKRGIDGFINGFHKKIKVLGIQNTQVFLEKL